jgi:hypothetical protein
MFKKVFYGAMQQAFCVQYDVSVRLKTSDGSEES